MEVSVFSPEQKLIIDLELPPEAWEYERLNAKDFGLLFRLIFWTGYVRGLTDTTSSLERSIRECVSTP